MKITDLLDQYSEACIAVGNEGLAEDIELMNKIKCEIEELHNDVLSRVFAAIDRLNIQVKPPEGLSIVQATRLKAKKLIKTAMKDDFSDFEEVYGLVPKKAPFGVDEYLRDCFTDLGRWDVVYEDAIKFALVYGRDK